MNNLKLKSFFIFDHTLRPYKRKPIEEEIQQAKIQYYFPNSEDDVIKRSNIGVIEGSISFLETFSGKEDKLLIVDLTKSLFISNVYEDTKWICMICLKTNPSDNTTFSYNYNTNQRRDYYSKLLDNLYKTLVIHIGPIKKFFSNYEYEDAHNILNDFIVNYSDSMSMSRLPIIDSVPYFPLNELGYSQILLAQQRLKEKIPEISYLSLVYKGHLLHNEVPIENFSLIYNTFFECLDSSSKLGGFTLPPFKVLQTVYTKVDLEEKQDGKTKSKILSNYRKAFDGVHSYYITGLSRLNINNFQVFLPRIHLIKLNTKNCIESYEEVQMLVYFHSGLTIFLFLKNNFQLHLEVNKISKLDKWIKRYFDEEIQILENLYQLKYSKIDSILFSYYNEVNRSIKLSSQCFKKNHVVNREKIDLFVNLLKVNHDRVVSSIYKIKGYYVFYFQACQRKILIFVTDNFSLREARTVIEETKKEMFDYIYII